jgi:hypothetical protein
MASGGEGFYMSVNYEGTRRGRADYGDFGHEMFPEKWEATNMEEDPEQTQSMWRTTLMDLSPEPATFAHEEARRNNYSRDRLNLREAGARVTTLPYSNDDYDTQFHDKDPRGWTNEQPWDEYRRLQRVKFSELDFKDDGDYSVPGEGIHPNTMYKNIKEAFYWVKDRMKWFSTSKDAWHNGGTGLKYRWRDAKAVGFTDTEDTSSMVDPRYMEADGRAHRTTQLSNIVNTGSKFLRANTTTDQEVKVASYGKLYKQKGLINHETQLRLTADDTQISKIEGMRAMPTNVVALMASGARDGTAAKNLRQSLQEAFGDPTKYPGVSEQQTKNRDRKITNDIMSLLGFTNNEVKWMESMKTSNRGAAEHMQAQLIQLVEFVHSLPAHVKLAMRDELMMTSLGKSLTPADPTKTRRARDNSVVNPKLVQYMDVMVRATEKPGDTSTARKMGWADPENKLHGIFANGELFATRGRFEGESNPIFNRQKADTQDEMLPGQRETRTKSYAALTRGDKKVQRNRNAGINVQDLQDTVARIRGQNLAPGDTRVPMLGDSTADNDFGENLFQDRHGGAMGSKYMRRYMEDDNDAVADQEDFDMREHGSVSRSRGRSTRVNG